MPSTSSASRSAGSIPSQCSPPAGRGAPAGTVTVSVRCDVTPELDIAAVVLNAHETAAVIAEQRGEAVHWRVSLFGDDGLLDAVRGMAAPDQSGRTMSVVLADDDAKEPTPERDAKPRANVRHLRSGGATVDGVRLSPSEARYL